MRKFIYSIIPLLMFTASITMVLAHEHQPGKSYLKVFQNSHLKLTVLKDFHSVKSKLRTVKNFLKASYAFSSPDYRNLVILDDVILTSAPYDEPFYLCHGQNYFGDDEKKKNHFIRNLHESIVYIDEDSYLQKRLEPTWPDLIKLEMRKLEIQFSSTKKYRKRMHDMYKLKNFLLEHGKFG